MPIDRDDSGTPEADAQALSGRLEPPSPAQVRATLASRLVPVVDRIRSLNARFGIRPYRVFLVHTAWSGGEEGVGHEEITSRIEILPVPLVVEMGSLASVLRPTGATEEGDVKVKEISARYTEDDLLGRTPDLNDPNLPRTGNQATDFFWEIVENRGQSPYPVVRRFSPRSVPDLRRDGFQWSVTLLKQDWDPGRSGSLDREAT